MKAWLFPRRDADPSRLVQLDILRGVAILLVIGRHPLMPAADAGVLKPVAALWLRFGWTGVDLFFVLSGFLVGGLLLKELRTRSQLDVGRFVVRRGFKIWPSYFAYLIFVFIVLFRQYRHGPRPLVHVGRLLLPNLLHVQNYLGTVRQHTWSLSVEEHFYLALPLLLLLLVGRRAQRIGTIRTLPIVGVTLMIVCTGLRIATRVGRPFDMYQDVYPTHLRIDGLFFGVMLAYCYHFKSPWLSAIAAHRTWLMAVGIAAVSPMMIMGIERPFVSTLGFTLLYAGYACILLAFLYAPLGVGWLGGLCVSPLGRALAWVGYFSYPVYLWHIDVGRQPVEFVLAHGSLAGLPASMRWIIAMGLFVGLAVGAGAVLGVLIERPALRLRERLFPARSTALGQVGDDVVVSRADLVETTKATAVAEPMQMGAPR